MGFQAARFLTVSVVALGFNLIVLELLVTRRGPRKGARAGDRNPRGDAAQLHRQQAVELRRPRGTGRRPAGQLARLAARVAATATAATVLCAPLPAQAADAADRPSSQAVEPSATLTRPASPTQPPRDHFLNAVQATRIAARHPKVRDELRGRDGVTRRAFAKGPGRWQVSWYAGGDEIAQAIVDEREGRAVEVWTGPQVAWQMARGLEGAFGRRVNSPWVWIPLMVAFFVAFFDPRRPLRLLHLDLLVLLVLLRLALFFNRGEIHTSVPLVYPVLVYLLVRMLTAGWGRACARAAGRAVHAGADPVPRAGAGLPGRLSRGAQPDRLERDRRRLLGRDRRGPAHARRGPVRDASPTRTAPATRTGRSPTTRTCRSSWRFPGPARGTTCRLPTRRRSRSTSPRCWRCSSSAAGCSPGRVATGSGWCSHTDGPPIRTPRSCSTRTRTTPSWRCW